MTPSPAGSPDALPAPGLLRRFAAMLYDSLLLFAVGWTVTAVAVGLRAASVGEAAIRASGKAAASGLLLQAAIAATTVLFFGWFWTRSGQTLGMQAWRLRVQQPDGSADRLAPGPDPHGRRGAVGSVPGRRLLVGAVRSRQVHLARPALRHTRGIAAEA
jgi:uncharacterized RDD family membrane protein YckC